MIICLCRFVWGAGVLSDQSTSILTRVPFDPVRCAVTIAHFPEWISLTGDEYSFEGSSSGMRSSTANSDATPPPPAIPYCPSAYDPSFFLLFCLSIAQSQLMHPRVFAVLGLLSFCLRCTAIEDDMLRGIAYECIALYLQHIDLSSTHSVTAAVAVEDEHVANTHKNNKNNNLSGARRAEDFRERAQLEYLLLWIQNCMTAPFMRLPAVHAVFAAEAVFAILHAKSPMYLPINKYIHKKAILDLEKVPLFSQMIFSGSTDAKTERKWLIHLLLCGLRSNKDVVLFQKQYIFELLMSFADSSVADRETASLAVHVLCHAVQIPRAARLLSEHSGLMGWLTECALHHIDRALQAAAPMSPSLLVTELHFKNAQRAICALEQITRLRAVVGKPPKGNKYALESFILMSDRLVTRFCGLSRSKLVLSSGSREQMMYMLVPVLKICLFCLRATRHYSCIAHHHSKDRQRVLLDDALDAVACLCPGKISSDNASLSSVLDDLSKHVARNENID